MNKIIKKSSILILAIILLAPINSYALTKKETIYSTLKYDGTVEKTVINNELLDITEGDIEDYSKLDKIVNINGKEKFTRESNKLIWKSTGNPIYYKGELNESLPIDVSVKYYLDGVESTPKKMIGKKGRVDIKIKYTNRDFNHEEGLYIPYVVSTNTIISNKNNYDFYVTTGKCVSTGNSTIVSAIASPGLYANTLITEFNNLDSTTISYKTDSFENIDLYFAISPKLLDEIDLSKLDELDNMTNSLNTLQDGMNQIVDGSSKLATGNQEIAKKAKMMSEGIGQLSNGMNQLDSNIQNINSTINNVTDTVNLLNQILASQEDNSITITPEQYNMLPENVRVALQNMIGLYNNNQNMVISLKELNLSLSATYELYGLDRDPDTITAELSNNLDEKTITLLLNTKKVYENNYESNEDLINQITNYMHEILLGEEGIINTLVYYLNTINDASIQLANGSSSINSGLSTIYDNSIKLSDALNQVSESTNLLSNGISKMNSEGINKLSELGKNINHYSDKAKRLGKLTNNYSGYSADNVNQTLFIYKLSTK